MQEPGQHCPRPEASLHGKLERLSKLEQGTNSNTMLDSSLLAFPEMMLSNSDLP